MPERAGPTLRAASPVYPEDSVVVRQRRAEERPVEARCSSLDSSLLQPSLFLRWSVGRTLVASLRSVRCVCFTATSENGATRTLARRPGLRSQTVTADTVKISTTRGGISGGKREEGETSATRRDSERATGKRFDSILRQIPPTSFQHRRRSISGLVNLSSVSPFAILLCLLTRLRLPLSLRDTTRGDDARVDSDIACHDT